MKGGIDMTRKLTVALAFAALLATTTASQAQWQVWAGRLALMGVGAGLGSAWGYYNYGPRYGHGPRYGYGHYGPHYGYGHYGPPRGYYYNGPPGYYYGGW
jgi:hypothetical protein